MPSGKRKTHEEYIEELLHVNPYLKPLGRYITGHTKIPHQCLLDGYIWDLSPNNALRGHGCPQCYGNIKRTSEEYCYEVSKINPDILVMEDYIGSNIKIKHKCKIDGYEWMSRPIDILRGTGCPCCSGKVIGPAPEYKNSIWASKYKDHFSQYLSVEQMKQYMPKSNQKINIECPYCGRPKQVIIAVLAENGMACRCSDGISYPNKFLYNILTQLNIDFQSEYQSGWTNNKIYDIYCQSLNLIIENHGIQHYEICEFTERTLSEEQENDAYKRNLALQNGISNYVVLDCRYSDMEWIKQSLMNSILPNLLNFKEQDINWNEAELFAVKNLVAEAAHLYNEGFNTKEISLKLHVAQSTVTKWLNRMTRIGVCGYNGKDEHVRVCSKKVMCVELKQVFQSITMAAQYFNVSITNISRCLCGRSKTACGYHWRYIS